MTRSLLPACMVAGALAGVCFLAGCPGPESPAPASNEFVIGIDTDRTGALASPSWQDAAQLAVDDMNQALAAKNKAFRFRLARADSTAVSKVALQRAKELANGIWNVNALITDSSSDHTVINANLYNGGLKQMPVVCMACTSPLINITRDDAAKNFGWTGPTPADLNADGWSFVLSTNARLQAKVLAKLVKEMPNTKRPMKVALYAGREPYGIGFSETLRQEIESQLRGTLITQIYHETASGTTVNYLADIARLLDKATVREINKRDGSVYVPDKIYDKYYDGANDKDYDRALFADAVPDVLVEMTLPQYAAGIMQAYFDNKATTPFLHNHTFRFNTVTQGLAGLIEGQEGTSHVLSDGVSGAVFEKRLRAATTLQPAFLDAQSYDSAMVIMLGALQAAGAAQIRDPTQFTRLEAKLLRNGMMSINSKAANAYPIDIDHLADAVGYLASGEQIDYQGASGPCDFSKQVAGPQGEEGGGLVRNRIVHWKVENNRFKDDETYDCVTDDACTKSN